MPLIADIKGIFSINLVSIKHMFELQLMSEAWTIRYKANKLDHISFFIILQRLLLLLQFKFMIVQEISSQNSQNFFNQQSKQSKVSQYVFQCPQTEFMNSRFETIEQMIQFLKVQSLNNHSFDIWRIKVQKPYCYFYCKYCTSNLHVKQINGEVVINIFENRHSHQTKQFKKIQQERIIKFINDLPFHYTDSDIKKFTLAQYPISQRRYYYILNKCRKGMDFEQLKAYFQQKSYQVRYRFGSQTLYPEIMMVITPFMFENYKQWGDVVTMDITYNIIKDKPKQSNQWGICLFTGMDSNLRLVLFGLAFVSKQTTESFQNLINQFLNIHIKHPSAFISDEQTSLKSAFNQLRRKGRFSGLHLLDNYHILKNLRKRVSQKNFQVYRSLIKAKNKQRFDYYINKLKSQDYNNDVLEQFLRKSSVCCFSQINKMFFGFNSTNSRCQKINDILKTYYPHSVPYTSFFYKFTKLQTHLLKNLERQQFQTKHYQLLFADYGIQKVRLSIQKKIFQKFIQTYSRGMRLQTDKIDTNFYVCYSERQKYYVTAEQKVICNCGYWEKSGMICAHMIRVLWSQGNYSYINYIKPRWIVEKKMEVERRGRPKKSRKNII